MIEQRAEVADYVPSGVKMLIRRYDEHLRILDEADGDRAWSRMLKRWEIVRTAIDIPTETKFVLWALILRLAMHEEPKLYELAKDAGLYHWAEARKFLGHAEKKGWLVILNRQDDGKPRTNAYLLMFPGEEQAEAS